MWAHPPRSGRTKELRCHGTSKSGGACKSGGASEALVAMPGSVGAAGGVVGLPAPSHGCHVPLLQPQSRLRRVLLPLGDLGPHGALASPRVLWAHSLSCRLYHQSLLLLERLQAFLWLRGGGTEQVVNVPGVDAKNNWLVTAPHLLLKIELLNECYSAKGFFSASFLGTI